MGLPAMSLINKMLQDLEERKSGGDALGAWQGQVRAAPAPRSRGIHWTAVLAVIGLLAGSVGAGAWWLGGQRTEMERAALPQPVIAAPPVAHAPTLALKLDHLPSMPVGATGDAVLHASAAGAEKRDPVPTSPPPSEALNAAPGEQGGSPGAGGAKLASALPPVPSGRASARSDAPAGDEMLRAQATAAPGPEQPPSAVPTRPAKATPAAREKARTADKPEVAEAEEAARPLKVSKQVTELTPQQRAENEYRRALVLVDQGKSREAMSALEAALQTDGRHTAARQTLAAILIDGKRPHEAIQKLNEGLSADRAQPGLAMMQARLQVDGQDLRSAIETLQLSLPYAVERADYRAFLAALLQREARHKEAIEHYLAALRKTPGNGLWWMGAGISLQAENRAAEARDAFGRARLSGSLSPDLLAFVEQRLAQLR